MDEIFCIVFFFATLIGGPCAIMFAKGVNKLYGCFFTCLGIWILYLAWNAPDSSDDSDLRYKTESTVCSLYENRFPEFQTSHDEVYPSIYSEEYEVRERIFDDEMESGLLDYDDEYDCSSDDCSSDDTDFDSDAISFRGKIQGKCNIPGHSCTGGIDDNSDGYCDVCVGNGYNCHMVLH